eukprot:752929-Hanusia_phi.AAC.2
MTNLDSSFDVLVMKDKKLTSQRQLNGVQWFYFQEASIVKRRRKGRWVAFDVLENCALENAYQQGEEEVMFTCDRLFPPEAIAGQVWGRTPPSANLGENPEERRRRDDAQDTCEDTCLSLVALLTRESKRGTWFYQTNDGSLQPYPEHVAGMAGGHGSDTLLRPLADRLECFFCEMSEDEAMMYYLQHGKQVGAGWELASTFLMRVVDKDELADV